MYEQIKFKDWDGVKHGGIINTDTGEVICACCGSTFESDDYKVIEIYDDWVDFTFAIIND